MKHHEAMYYCDVNRTLDAISRRDVISFFQECGYYKYR